MFWWTVFLLIWQTTRRSFDHLRDVSMVFPFFWHKKVQHCKRHGVLNKNADPECGGCISVRSCRSAAAANTCNFFRERGASGSATAQCAKESCRTPTLNKQTRVELPKCEPGPRRSQKQSTAYDTVLGTTGEALRRGPELHRKDLTISLYQVVARARRYSDAAVLQV